jgi:hypothetical protein
MKCRIDREQGLSRQMEKKPGDKQSRQTLKSSQCSNETAPLREGRIDHFPETSGANDPVIVFGDAFPAIKMSAVRAARRGLSQRMIETALED